LLPGGEEAVAMARRTSLAIAFLAGCALLAIVWVPEGSPGDELTSRPHASAVPLAEANLASGDEATSRPLRPVSSDGTTTLAAESRAPRSASLTHPWTVRGTVFRGSPAESAWKPISGAGVTIAHPASGGAFLHTRTDEQGRFRIGSLKSPAGCSLEVQAEGFVPTFLFPLIDSGHELDLGPVLLHPAATLRGRAVDERGAPIAGAMILLGVPMPVEESDAFHPRTQKDGTFTVPSLPPCAVSVGARKAGFADAAVLDVTLSAEHPSDVELKMIPEVPLEGRVVDEKGDPVADAIVEATCLPAEVAYWRTPVKSDARGAFRIEGVDATRKGLRGSIQKQGLPSMLLTEAAIPANGLYVLCGGSVVELNATDARGSPRPIREVIQHCLFFADRVWSHSSAVQRQRALVPHIWEVLPPVLGPGERCYVTYCVSALDGSSGVGEARITSDAFGRVKVAIDFADTGSLVGRVVTRDGMALPGVAVRATSWRAFSRPLARVRDEPPAEWTDKTGSFRFGALPEGDVWLSVNSPDWTAAPVGVRVRPAGAGPIDLVVRRPSRIAGRVLFNDYPLGRPIRVDAYELIVPPGESAYASERPIVSTTASDDGSFALGPLWEATYLVVPDTSLTPASGATWEPFGSSGTRSKVGDWPPVWPWRAQAPPEGDAYLIVNLGPFERPGVLRGAVTLNGLPCPGATIAVREVDCWRARERGILSRSVVTDRHGEYSLAVPNRSTLRVSVQVEEAHESKTITVEPGKQHLASFELVTGSVHGRVTDRSGTGVSVQIAAERETRFDMRRHFFFDRDDEPREVVAPRVTSGPDGSFAFPDLGGGRYRLVVTDPQRRFATAASDALEVTEKSSVEAPAIVLSRTSPLRITVKDENGFARPGSLAVEAPRGASPLLEPLEECFASETTFRIHGLRSGPLVVRFVSWHRAYESAEQLVALPDDGSEVAIELPLRRAYGPDGFEAKSALDDHCYASHEFRPRWRPSGRSLYENEILSDVR
jgi:carboxypeptidase family protein